MLQTFAGFSLMYNMFLLTEFFGVIGDYKVVYFLSNSYSTQKIIHCPSFCTVAIVLFLDLRNKTLHGLELFTEFIKDGLNVAYWTCTTEKEVL